MNTETCSRCTVGEVSDLNCEVVLETGMKRSNDHLRVSYFDSGTETDHEEQNARLEHEHEVLLSCESIKIGFEKSIPVNGESQANK